MMRRHTKKKVPASKTRSKVWVNPDIRKLLAPPPAIWSHPEMRSSGFGQAMLRQRSDATEKGQ